MKKYLAIACLIFGGCATTSGLDPVVSHSGFDNAKTVSIVPHGTVCKSSVCTGIGAQWNKSKPDRVILLVSVFSINKYTSITKAELNIDGQIIELTPTNTVTDMSGPGDGIKKSSKGFVAQISIVKQILSAKRVWLRVHTPTGYLEDAVLEGETDSKAYHALKRFMNAVES